MCKTDGGLDGGMEQRERSGQVIMGQARRGQGMRTRSKKYIEGIGRGTGGGREGAMYEASKQQATQRLKIRKASWRFVWLAAVGWERGECGTKLRGASACWTVPSWFGFQPRTHAMTARALVFQLRDHVV